MATRHPPFCKGFVIASGLLIANENAYRLIIFINCLSLVFSLTI
jgi:hypothetical protein